MNHTFTHFLKIIHRWVGLIGGWFLFIILISGSLSLFDIEITQWMQPELAIIQPEPLTSKALNEAYKFWTYHQNSPKNLIILPTQRDPYLRVLHMQDKVMQGKVLDPHKGDLIPVRATAGGFFINAIHKNLFLDRYWGGMIILIVSIILFISILTGITLHYKDFFKNIFNLQLKASPLRVQINYHTTIGFLFTPFLLIIAYSSFSFLSPRYLSTEPTKKIPTQFVEPTKLQTTPPQNLLFSIQQVENYFHNPAHFIFFSSKEIKVIEDISSHLTFDKNYLALDKQTGQITSHSIPATGFQSFKNTLLGIHKARAGGLLMRTINFIMGIGTAFCLACGLLYYTNRYKRKKNLSKFNYIYHKIIEGTNIGIIMGTLIGFSSYFWINRFIPFIQPNRILYEITTFFTIITFILIYCIYTSFLNRSNKTFKKLLLLLSNICLLLPIIDLITTTTLFKQALLHHNYLYITMDLIICFFGLCFLQLYYYIQRKDYLA